jgi:NADH-quinone oxidoreductase subunit L
MVLALGLSAYGASIFEAFAQLWPKALLFLAAGVMIRELRTERMDEMGGLLRRMPLTSWTMLIAAAAMAGVPPFSTFWSKDTILSKALAIQSGPGIVVIVLVTLLGALAVGRIFCLVCLGETARRRRFEPERIRDASGRIALAMVLFAIPSVIAGIRGIRGRTDPIAFVTFPGVTLANSHLTGALIVAVVSLAGAGIAYLVYGRRAGRLALTRATRFVSHALDAGRAYGLAFSRGVLPASRGVDLADQRVIDGGTGLVAESVEYAGQPRRLIPDLSARLLAIGLLTGLFMLALLSIVLTRLFGVTG